MAAASLLLNIFVLLPICSGLFLRFPQFVRVYGEDGTARQILLCLYFAILVVSAAILFWGSTFSEFLLPLLSLQIFYKFLSVFLIKDKKTPVLWFNLAIAIFHCGTVYSLLN